MSIPNKPLPILILHSPKVSDSRVAFSNVFVRIVSFTYLFFPELPNVILPTVLLFQGICTV
jgi:hypothetical protein